METYRKHQNALRTSEWLFYGWDLEKARNVLKNAEGYLTALFKALLMEWLMSSVSDVDKSRVRFSTKYFDWGTAFGVAVYYWKRVK